MAFEKYILPDFEQPKMSIHLFRAVMGEYIAGQITKAQSITVIEAHLGVTLTTNEKSDLQALTDAIDLETTTEEKMAVADETYRVLIMAESGVSGYETKANLKSRLSWV